MTSIDRHYITTAAKNASQALSMAMYLWVERVDERGSRVDMTTIQDLVHIINTTSESLRRACKMQAESMKEGIK